MKEMLELHSRLVRSASLLCFLQITKKETICFVYSQRQQFNNALRFTLRFKRQQHHYQLSRVWPTCSSPRCGPTLLLSLSRERVFFFAQLNLDPGKIDHHGSIGKKRDGTNDARDTLIEAPTDSHMISPTVGREGSVGDAFLRELSSPFRRG